MTDEKFKAFTKSLSDKKLQPDSNMAEETSRHWGEIKERRYDRQSMFSWP